jgi:hypothetical protein
MFRYNSFTDHLSRGWMPRKNAEWWRPPMQQHSHSSTFPPRLSTLGGGARKFSLPASTQHASGTDGFCSTFHRADNAFTAGDVENRLTRPTEEIVGVDL